MYFSDLELSDDILDALYDMHFDECTPIQEQCIPPILEGRDVMGIAQTGTGKTVWPSTVATTVRAMSRKEKA